MKPKKVKSICIPLDPDECGSTVHGYVRFPQLDRNTYGKKKWFIQYGANISLSDCNRVIQWSLTADDNYDVAKLDRAISALTRFREYMVQAQVEMVETMKEKASRNLAIDPENKDD